MFSARRAETPASLLRRYIAWRGGSAFRRLKALRIRSEAIAGAGAGLRRDEDAYARIGQWRRDISIGDTDQSLAIDGGTGWRRTASGQVVTLSAAEAASFHHELTMRFCVFPPPPGVEIALVGTRAGDPPHARALRFSFPDGGVHELLLDRRSGALLAQTSIADGRTTTYRYSDWRRVDGILFPFTVEIGSPLAAVARTARVVDLQVNPKFTATHFVKPEAVKAAAFSGGERSTGFIPFDLVEGGLIFLNLKLNGHDVEVALDSGAGASVVDKRLAAEVGLIAQGEFAAIGLGGSETWSRAAGARFELGPLSLNGLSVLVGDLAPLEAISGLPIRAILGVEIFNELIVDIDFASRRIAFSAPEHHAPPPGATTLALESQAGLRTVPISIEGRPAVAAQFDLGNGSALGVFAPYWEDAGLADGRRRSTTLGGGVGGFREVVAVTLASVRFAGIEFPDVPAGLMPANPAAAGSRHAPANVGLEILKRFRVITDFPADRLHLVPGAALDAPFLKDRAGLATRPDPDRLTVLHVSLGSPGEVDGWKAGDAIVAIDGQPIGPGFARTPLAQWGAGQAGSVLDLTLAEGSTRRMVLQDYF